MHTCPVCGFNELPQPAEDFAICPSCGTEFGYHDSRASFDELRREWMGRGVPWSSPVLEPPMGWEPFIQLIRAGLVPDLLSALKPAANTTPSFANVQMMVDVERSSISFEHAAA